MFLKLLTTSLLKWSYDTLGYEHEFDPAKLNYDLLVKSARMAHCDGEFLAYSLGSRYKSDYESSCGEYCRQMQQFMGTKISVTSGMSKTDHTQFVIFQSNVSVNIGESVSTPVIAAFRGTLQYDIITLRRNLYFKFALTTLCEGCALHSGFWRNFLALRPSFVCALDDIGMATTTVLVGISMGAPLATLGAVNLFAIGGNVQGCVTFGMPRMANAQLAVYVLTTLVAGVGAVGFAYGRDPVPHVPPRWVGYVSVQSKTFHIWMHWWDDRSDVDVSEFNTLIDDFDFASHLTYSKVYLNSAWDFGGDKEFARSSSSFNLADHTGYLQNLGSVGCGMDNADEFLHVSEAAELFFM